MALIEPPPQVTGLAPHKGPLAGGNVVTVTGNGFTGATSVRFGSATPAIDFTVVNDTTITATAPAHAAGLVNVFVDTTGGPTAATQAAWYTYENGAGPTVTGVTPIRGTENGGTAVTIKGTGFGGATGARFGGTSSPTEVTVWNDTTITAISPPHAEGLVCVFIDSSYGTSANTPGCWYIFTTGPPPIVAKVSPSTGTHNGGSVVTITGQNLGEAYNVRFGAWYKATSFVVINANTIQATTPSHPAGLVNVFVDTPGGVNPNQMTSWYLFT